ncbi:MAG TPA: hypothetical protein VLM91_08945 [Candidatus Methylomirabilis sp.]|nr:hypothetical protein [Candidatus Methylomirabilis sp.]
MNVPEERLLRTAFLVGAVTDAAALLPMLFTRLAEVLWGFRDVSGSYRFAMGYGGHPSAADPQCSTEHCGVEGGTEECDGGYRWS